jgi:GntR family transcriptional regulator
MAKKIRISRVPVRRALSLLENEGMLRRHRGRGTFVLKKEFAPKAPILSNVIEDYVTSGLQRTLGLLSMERFPAPTKAVKSFEISDGEILMLIRCLRKVEGMPYFYVMNYLPIADLKTRTMVSISEDRMGISF